MGEFSQTQLLAALAARAASAKAETFSPAALLHRKQAHAYRMDRKARRRAIVGGRRGGKTYGIDVTDLETSAQLGWQNLYVTLTRLNAKEIAWGDLLELNDRYKLRGEANLTDLSMKFPSGGLIALRGANNEREIAKIRGKKWHRVKVDECQSIPDRILVPLLGPIIPPTLLDFGGELWCAGSRPAVRAGHWFRITEGDLAENWEQHRFDIRDNDKLPAVLAGVPIEEILAEFRKDQGWTEDDPTYKREVLNMDIQDLEALLFAYRSGVNDVDALPEGLWAYVFGIDIGSVDADAIMVWGWRKHDSGLYLCDEYMKAGEDVTDLANAIKEMAAIYHPISMVIDEGGGGKKSVEELRRRHALPLKAAEKTSKPAYIRMMNADFRKGVIKVLRKKCPVFCEDMVLVRKDPEALARNVLQELPASKGGYHSDAADGGLYGWREAYNWLERPAPPQPKDENEALVKRLYQQQRKLEDPDRDPIAALLGFGD
jgi:hypothetical protein